MEEFEKLAEEYEVVGHSYEKVEGMKGDKPYKETHLRLTLKKEGETREHFINITGSEEKWRNLLK